MTTELRFLPAAADLVFRPGDPFSFRVIGWDSGTLTGRTFEVTVGDQEATVDVVGDTLEVSMTAVQTADAFETVATVDWTLDEPDSSQTFIVGQAHGLQTGGASRTSVLQISSGTPTIALQLIDLPGAAAGVAAQLDAHLLDANGAHAASAISATATGGLVGANVALQLSGLDTRLTAVEADDAGDDAAIAQVASDLVAEAALARNADNLSSGTVADARIASTIARDSEVTAAVAAEATLARNADNLTSGTVADARIASTIARDSEVTAAVAAEAVLARNGDNITSGTVADARIASTIARDSEVTAAITAALTGTISNGDTTHAPTGDAVFDALALKLDSATASSTYVGRLADEGVTLDPIPDTGGGGGSGASGWTMNKPAATPFPHVFRWSIDDNPKWETGMDYQDEDFVLVYDYSVPADTFRVRPGAFFLMGRTVGQPAQAHRLHIKSDSADPVALENILYLEIGNGSPADAFIRGQFNGAENMVVTKNGQAAFGRTFSGISANGNLEVKGGAFITHENGDPFIGLERTGTSSRTFTIGLDSASGNAFYVRNGGSAAYPLYISASAPSNMLLVGNDYVQIAASGQKLAFFGGAGSAVVKQSITGSRGGNAALADLITKLAAYGLITDGTSA